MKRVRKLLTRLYPRLNTVPKPLIVTLLILFALVALRTLSLPPSPTSFSFPRNPFPDRSPNETVSVWYHPRCRGAFTTSAAPDAHNGFPYAAVRDATVDRRPATKTELGYHDPPGVQRIMLFVSCHLSARLTREGAFVTVEGSDVLAAVEYVIHANKFLTRGKYAPGKRTIFGREVTEWHVGIRLQPAPSALESAVHDAFRHDRQINISLPVIRYDEKIIPMFVNMNAACVMGVRTPGVHRAEECATDHRTATGAVLFSGSSLYGTKKRSKQHFREVANFAARALLGPIRYHTVVMSVVTDFSQSDADYRCAASESCRLRLDLDNHKHLTSIAQTVMDELDAIGVPRALFSRLIILPSCRLGSDPWKSEREDPCRSSKRYGQYYATFFSYAILAPYFKWAASYDMDEFLSPVPAQARKLPLLAEDALDEAEASIHSSGGNLVFQWLNFRILSSENARALSQNVLKGQVVEKLKNRVNASESFKCYDRLGDNTGKSAVRCDVGVGFSIHHPIVNVPGKRMMSQRQGNLIYRGLRTWHARFLKSKVSRRHSDVVP